MAYRCIHAEKRVAHPFLLCKKSQKDGINYNNKANALEVYCPYQRYCTCEHGVINTDEAKSCLTLSKP